MYSEYQISCPRTGGTKMAIVCIHYDCYRFCRKNCASLNALIKKNPEILEKINKILATRGKEKNQGVLFETKFSGKNIPNPSLRCKWCRFTAKSERGLKIHYKRTHKKELAGKVAR